MFNIQGSEMIFLLLVALIILGPEKLPDAIRKFGRAYSEFKKMANGFQGEMRQVLDEPMRELKDTADMMRNAVNFGDDAAPSAPTAADPATPPAPIVREQGLNFGSANPRRTAPEPEADPATPPIVREPGLNFGSANPRRTAATPEPAAADAADPAGLDAALEPGVDGAAEAPAPQIQVRRGPRSVRDQQPVPADAPTVAPAPDAETAE